MFVNIFLTYFSPYDIQNYVWEFFVPPNKDLFVICDTNSAQYTPLSVKICFLLWKFHIKIFKIFIISEKKFPNVEFFFQNFQYHKGAANDIKGAATSLLVNSKISIFN